MILRDVAADYQIHGQTNCCSIKRRGRQYSPRSQWLQDRPQKCCVSREDVLERVHQRDAQQRGNEMKIGFYYC